MDIVLLIKAMVMGIVEGLTEFLPISSTGHLILAGQLLDFLEHDKRQVFEISIQTGAIFAVILVYWQKIRTTLQELPTEVSARKFALNVVIGFLPAVILGLLFGKVIKAHLFNPMVVASTFIIGGFIILWAEQRQARGGSAVRVADTDDMSWQDALKVGLVQCLAMIPGTSRSLLEKYCDVNYKNNDNNTPLIIASQAKKANIVQLLITKGAEVNPANSKGETALLWAIWNDDVETAKLLIEKGADLSAMDYLKPAKKYVKDKSFIEYLKTKTNTKKE